MGKRKAITDAQARAFTATAGREAVLWDGVVSGLGVRALPSGRKTWFVHRRVGDGFVKRTLSAADAMPVALMAAFGINEVQADAILNMRLRALRRLEEAQIRREHEALEAERDGLEQLAESPRRQKTALAAEIAETKKRFGQETALGARRTVIGRAPQPQAVPVEALVEREPVTVICSAKGWIRAVRGHAEAETAVRYKDGDRERFRFHAQTTDRLLLFATNGRFYTLAAEKTPRRARLRRAGAPDDRPRQRSRAGGALRPPPRPPPAGGSRRWARLLRAVGRRGGPDPQRVPGAQPGARRGATVCVEAAATRWRSSAATAACWLLFGAWVARRSAR